MNEIARIRETAAQDVFDYQVLLDVLRDYRKPRDRIRRLVAAGEIIRVKKGLYVFAAPWRRQPLVREQLANLIYGPSYVSLESALSYHGLIPERVEAVTSVTTGRSRAFETPFGVFSYMRLSPSRYGAGILLEAKATVPFMIASPEKALADKVWTDKRFAGASVGDFAAYLFEDLRIDEGALRSLDAGRLAAVGRAYGSAKTVNLLRFLDKLRSSRHA